MTEASRNKRLICCYRRSEAISPTFNFELAKPVDIYGFVTATVTGLHRIYSGFSNIKAAIFIEIIN